MRHRTALTHQSESAHNAIPCGCRDVDEKRSLGPSSEPRRRSGALWWLHNCAWSAFAALVEANNGIFGGCWCMGFHREGGDKGATAGSNRDLKLSRVRAGTAHAALVFDQDDCVGWCQFGEPDEVSRIKSRAAYERELVRLPDWRIGCCYVGKGHRRAGALAAALAGALDLIADHGGGIVEGYPEPADAVSAGFLYNGALSTYEDLGFRRDRKIGKHRWVVTRAVETST